MPPSSRWMLAGPHPASIHPEGGGLEGGERWSRGAPARTSRFSGMTREEFHQHIRGFSIDKLAEIYVDYRF